LDACCRLDAFLPTEFRFIHNQLCNIASKIAANFDKNQITPRVLFQINQFISREKKNNEHFKLPQNSLDEIYKIYNEAKTMSNLITIRHSENNDTIKSCMNILFAQQYYSEERLIKLFEHLNQLVEEDVNNVGLFLNTILKYENFYASNLPDELSLFFRKLFVKIKQSTVEDESFIDYNLSDMLMKLNKVSNKDSLDLFDPMSTVEFEKLKENLNKTVDSMIDLNEKIKSKECDENALKQIDNKLKR